MKLSAVMPSSFAAIALQEGVVASDPWDLILFATPITKIILIVLAAFSLVSWVAIFWKWKAFKRVAADGDRFVDGISEAEGLHGIYRELSRLPESAYTRVFRRGVNFFTELRPTALRDAPDPGGTSGLTPAQLEALSLVLGKELSEERDNLAHGLVWLAIIGSVSPLLGLMGTVLGVMNAFIGITAQGTANIAAVAPGVAEALVTTVAGLGVAIPAVIAYNHYAGKLALFTGELEGFASEFIGTLAREGRV
ncbi:MAG: MotA/TolQ/ExbB proton channel family protein [Gemmatimonadota bacterium]